MKMSIAFHVHIRKSAEITRIQYVQYCKRHLNIPWSSSQPAGSNSPNDSFSRLLAAIMRLLHRESHQVFKNSHQRSFRFVLGNSIRSTQKLLIPKSHEKAYTVFVLKSKLEKIQFPTHIVKWMLQESPAGLHHLEDMHNQIMKLKELMASTHLSFWLVVLKSARTSSSLKITLQKLSCVSMHKPYWVVGAKWDCCFSS